MSIFQHILESYNQHYGNYILVAIVTIFLGIASYTDIKSLKIPNKLNLTFGIIAVLVFVIYEYSWMDISLHLIGATFGFFALLIPAMIRMHKMGGDIKAITVVGLFIGIEIMPFFLAISCITALIYIVFRYFILKKIGGNMPFAPFFLLTHFILFLVNLIL